MEELPMTDERQQEDINDVQHLFFELFRRIRYNLLDGERVVRDLLDWHDLWYSVLPTRFPYSFNTQKEIAAVLKNMGECHQRVEMSIRFSPLDSYERMF